MRSSDKNPAIAILCSDLHISHKPPIARSCEKDWYGVMEYYFHQLKVIRKNAGDNVKIICAGDVFDTPEVPPETISFAIKHMPEMIAVPGQHDLHNHNYDNLRRSAYHTLVAAGKIKNLEPEDPTIIWSGRKIWYAVGFPWGFELSKPRYTKSDKSLRSLAVCHDYVWWDKTNCYKNAPKSKHIDRYMDKLDNYYDFAVFGDNHKWWYKNEEKTPILNCGTFMRRKMDEFNYKPSVSILYEGGNSESILLDCEQDKFIDVDEALTVIEKAIDSTQFVGELSKLVRTLADFGQSLREFCDKNNISSRVKDIIDEVLGESSETE